ncbi:MAG: ribosome biogenesis GTP-binding protein YihA/YsxC [Desulfuromonas thiophila]|nr:ribosome biogenesis GTP-binding protein YihA/YsxC [Desulfuromonas thiophila]
MHVTAARFVKSATRPAHYPAADFPEIAFAGRSNVGKSSLLNVLLQRRNLVRTSSTPGRTQLINFFILNEALSLVDLPGYGFAKVPLAVKNQWGPMVQTYLQSRPTLAALVLLFDIRREPRPDDLQLLDWLEQYQVPTIAVITKADKVGRSQWTARRKAIAEAAGLPVDAFTLFSAQTRQGCDELWERLQVALEQWQERAVNLPINETISAGNEPGGVPDGA